MIREKLLQMLVCPEDRTPLAPATPELLEQLNREIAAKKVKNRAGQVIEEPLEAGLVRRDGQLLYPMVDNIPTMLLDEAIPLEPAGGQP